MDFSQDGDAWYFFFFTTAKKKIVEIFPVFRFGSFSTEMLNFTGSLIEKSSKYLEFS
jgi:hypothetical protein